MQEDGNGVAMTNYGDGEVFTALRWTVGQGQYSVEGRKQVTVRLCIFPPYSCPFLFCLIIDFRQPFLRPTKSRRRPGGTKRATTMRRCMLVGTILQLGRP